MLRRLLPALALLTALGARAASAQDVEMLGRRSGKRPPQAYYDAMSRNPNAFRFAHGRAERMRTAAALRSSLRAGPSPAGGGGRVPAHVGLGPRTAAVVGDFYIPVVLGLFSDSSLPPVTATTIQDGYFGSQSGTVAEYYAEVSSDSIALHGVVLDWVTSPMTQANVTEGISGLGCCGIGDYIRSLLDLQSPSIDWGAFDNDGPDGVPNSGDDDGYVDALAVIHPTPGAECPGSNPDWIWSHKWTLSEASSSGTAYETGTPSNAVGVPSILVDDYFVQPAVKCPPAVGLNEIGVFTHELGHAFGLPDLYDTREIGAHEGAGEWDLMASGTYGCSGTAPYSPCHMGAWSKAALGWVTVDALPPDTDLGTLVLPPVESTGVVYRFDARDGSDDYFLLENRQRQIGAYDQMLWSEGLLIWQIDAGLVDARWLDNTVNSATHMGVWLRQADGLDQLGSSFGNRGDAGDPFPGATANTAFHAATNPAARSFEGTATGLSLLNIAAPAGSDDVSFHARTLFATVEDQGVDLVATVPSDVQLTVQGGTAPISWSLVGGTPPDGITLQTDGKVVGVASDLGLFPLSVEATDAVGLTGTATVTLNVGEPSFSIDQLSADFLLRDQALDSIQATFLDHQGNDDGTYDLGDFRAWVLAHPSLPLSAQLSPRASSAPETRVFIVPLTLGEPEGGP